MDSRIGFRKSGILLGVRQTTLFQRFTAKGIDLLVAFALFFLGDAFVSGLGALAAGVFSAMQDSLGEGQSLGKRIMGLRVMDEYTGLGCSFTNSLLRNLPLALFFLLMPLELLWGLALLLIVPVLVLEVYLLFNVETGVRLGDVIGNTWVVEYYREGDNIAH